ncbi:MAG: hypothetical protein KDD44_15105, partial [Bdellovibrionales bacterium]|nr:hypothetical protein [Bdellovibrionales bacterium]
FANGDERYIFRNRHQEVSARYVRSFGDPEEVLHRLSAGYGYVSDAFSEADLQDFADANVDPGSVSQDPALLAEDRTFSGPFVVYDRIQAEFISINYVDRFERIEDFNLGPQSSVRLQFAPEFLDSTDDVVLFTASQNGGHQFSPTAFIRGEVGAASRIGDFGFQDSIIRTEAKYYNVLGIKYLGPLFIGKHTLAANFSFEYGEDFDKDRELLLGATNGLRGYEDRTFTGNKRVVLNVEDRFHLFENVFKLFSIGGAVFADAGGSTFRPVGRLFSNEIYGDVGFGLRLGFPRASGSGVIRIDLAFPLRNGPDGSGVLEPRLFISTGQLFTGRLLSERVGAEQANVSVGQNR